jgi:periplasmic copper chaperone A
VPRPVPAATSRLRLLTTVLVAAAVTACAGGEAELQIGDARAATPTGGSSQVLVEVHNAGDAADTLLGADSDAVAAVEIHRTEVDGGRATMEQLEELEIPARETVRFRPGSLHLMLVAPDETVVEGGTFELVLRFEQTGEVPLDVEVVPLADIVDDALPE